MIVAGDFAPAGATKGLSDRPLETFGAYAPILDFFRGFFKREGSTFVEGKYAFDAESTINHMKNKNTIAQTGILCYTERG